MPTIYRTMKAGEIIGAMLLTSHNLSLCQEIVADLLNGIVNGLARPIEDKLLRTYASVWDGEV